MELFAVALFCGLVGFLLGMTRKKKLFLRQSIAEFSFTLDEAKSMRSKALEILDPRDNTIELDLLSLPETIQNQWRASISDQVKALEPKMFSLSQCIDELTSSDTPLTIESCRRGVKALEKAMSPLDYPLRNFTEHKGEIEEQVQRFSTSSLLSTLDEVRILIDAYQSTIETRLDEHDSACRTGLFKQFRKDTLLFHQEEIEIRQELAVSGNDRGMVSIRLENLRKRCMKQRATHVEFDANAELHYLLNDWHFRSEHYRPALWKR